MDGLKVLERLARLAQNENIPACAPGLTCGVLQQIAAREPLRVNFNVLGICWAAASSTAAVLALSFLYSGGDDSTLLEALFSTFDPLIQLTSAAGV